MKYLRSLLFTSALSIQTFACGTADTGNSLSQSDDQGTDQSDFTTSVRQAQLDGLRVRVQKDFAYARSLTEFKLVFKVHRIAGDSDRAFIQARIMRRDTEGNDSELTSQNLGESPYGTLIEQGMFDGPEVIAVLKRSGTKWNVVTKGADNEAYVVGPTDVAYTDWDTRFGIPRAWMFPNGG